LSANNIKGKKKISFSVVRYGNVINSRGSVVPKLLKEESSGKFSITDLKMTRFSITLQEGVEAVIWSLFNCKGGEIVIPKIPSYNLLTLTKAINKKNKIRIIGIRPGEKIHEEMILPSDSYLTIDIGKYYIIANNLITKKNIKKRLRGKNVKLDFHYKSDTNNIFLNEAKLKKIILNEISPRDI